MSKIGKKPIDISDVQVDVKGQEVFFKGKNSSGSYKLPDFLKPVLKDGFLNIEMPYFRKDCKKFWGLHRSLLANEIWGSKILFEKKLEINGLGFKAQLTGNQMKFSLGYSHKIDYELPKEVSVQIDKTGQKLTFNSANKDLLGKVCDAIRSFRVPEPYKGTGIKLESEIIIRKAGKTKAV